MGEPMLPQDQLAAAPHEIIYLHQQILKHEKWLLSLKEKITFPVFAVRVSDEYVDWGHEFPSEVFFVSFEDVFNMLHLRRLSLSFLRLWALHLTSAIVVDNIMDVAIADPEILYQDIFKTKAGCTRMAKYLTKFMLQNQDKANLLVPYCPQ